MKRIINRLSIVFLLVAAAVASVDAQKTYLVAVGLGNYENRKDPLPCSEADAKGIASFFDAYTNSDVFVMIDSNATRDHILRVLKNKFSQAGPNDEIIFAYSGHGFDGGITSYENNGVIYCSEIQDILAKSNAGRKIMFINSCHSGSFTKKYKNDSRAKSYKTNKSDVMIYLSSRANELSWETDAMRNSFFFSALLNGLRGRADVNNDKIVTARELFNYVNKDVINITDNQQHPQMYGKFPDNMSIVDLR